MSLYCGFSTSICVLYIAQVPIQEGRLHSFVIPPPLPFIHLLSYCQCEVLIPFTLDGEAMAKHVSP